MRISCHNINISQLFTFGQRYALQIPRYKFQYTNNSQLSITNLIFNKYFSHWSLEIIWKLKIGNWKFQCIALASIVSVALSLKLLLVDVIHCPFYFHISAKIEVRTFLPSPFSTIFLAF